MIWLPATRHDVILLCRAMRQSDQDECLSNAIASGRFNTIWSVRHDLFTAFENDPIWALWDGIHLVGLAGVASLQQHLGFGAIWFLGTTLADTKWRAMTRACRRFIAMQDRHWTRMGNIVPANMPKRIKWLEKLGFDMEPPEAQQLVKGHVTFWLHRPIGPKMVQRP